MPEKKQWFDERPTHCQVCDGTLHEKFIDGRTQWGPWALMCTTCHSSYGCGLGSGRGQAYDLDTLEKLEG